MLLASLRKRGDMTPRARTYLIIGALRHLLTGVVVIAYADALRHISSLDEIRTVAPLWVWGVVMLWVGVGCSLAAWRENEAIARAALVLSATSMAAWAAGFLAGGVHGELANPLLAIWSASLAGKDLTVCAQPLRSPFERLVRDLSP